uniref:LSD1 LSD1 zinc finger n=1 Tax=Siphoviridae sp. ctbxa26 TaxID=2825568 RepID=A0A8S5VEU0_9CAUD|nr:MAG TPA: LSD1 LSD1 zinc finger [Siphoviridae sp. ctbxa26]
MFLIVCIFSCRRGTHETKALCKCKVLLLYPKGAII